MYSSKFLCSDKLNSCMSKDGGGYCHVISYHTHETNADETDVTTEAVKAAL